MYKNERGARSVPFTRHVARSILADCETSEQLKEKANLTWAGAKYSNAVGVSLVAELLERLMDPNLEGAN